MKIIFSILLSFIIFQGYSQLNFSSDEYYENNKMISFKTSFYVDLDMTYLTYKLPNGCEGEKAKILKIKTVQGSLRLEAESEKHYIQLDIPIMTQYGKKSSYNYCKVFISYKGTYQNKKYDLKFKKPLY